LRRPGAAAAGLSVLVAVVLAACGGGGDAAQATTLEARIAAIDAEVRTRIGPAVCAADSDCRALPMGARACGGPSAYLPYSIRGTDEGPLARLSDDHRRLSEELNRQRQAIGTCEALAEPVPYCERSAPLACKLR
jgi:hypothetical protein